MKLILLINCIFMVILSISSSSSSMDSTSREFRFFKTLFLQYHPNHYQDFLGKNFRTLLNYQIEALEEYKKKEMQDRHIKNAETRLCESMIQTLKLIKDVMGSDLFGIYQNKTTNKSSIPAQITANIYDLYDKVLDSKDWIFSSALNRSNLTPESFHQRVRSKSFFLERATIGEAERLKIMIRSYQDDIKLALEHVMIDPDTWTGLKLLDDLFKNAENVTQNDNYRGVLYQISLRLEFILNNIAFLFKMRDEKEKENQEKLPAYEIPASPYLYQDYHTKTFWFVN